MIYQAKDIIKVLDEYETDLWEEHREIVLQKKNDDQTVITAAQIQAVREIRDRLKLPEIKA